MVICITADVLNVEKQLQWICENINWFVLFFEKDPLVDINRHGTASPASQSKGKVSFRVGSSNRSPADGARAIVVVAAWQQRGVEEKRLENKFSQWCFVIVYKRFTVNGD